MVNGCYLHKLCTWVRAISSIIYPVESSQQSEVISIVRDVFGYTCTWKCWFKLHQIQHHGIVKIALCINSLTFNKFIHVELSECLLIPFWFVLLRFKLQSMAENWMAFCVSLICKISVAGFTEFAVHTDQFSGKFQGAKGDIIYKQLFISDLLF